MCVTRDNDYRAENAATKCIMEYMNMLFTGGETGSAFQEPHIPAETVIVYIPCIYALIRTDDTHKQVSTHTHHAETQTYTHTGQEIIYMSYVINFP